MTITAPADGGIYVVTSFATILQNSFSTNTALTTNYSFTLTIQSDCVNTVIENKTIIDMSYKVSLAAVTQDISFTDTIATSHAGQPAYCGARTYTLSPTHTFLTISGSTMSLSTATVTDVGTYNVSLTVSLASYSGVTSVTKSFIVTISCEVQTLTFITAPAASTTLQIGIEVQPSTIAYTIGQTPACGNVGTFSMSPSISFLSLQTLTSATGGYVQINGANIADHNNYA